MAIKIPQVRETGLPSTTGVKTPNAEAFGAGVGDALGGLGSALGDIGLDLQNKENNAKARESDTYYTQKVGNLQLAYEQQNGEAAYKGNPDYEQAVRDIRREAEEMLDNDNQREMVRPLFDNKENSAILSGKSHSIKALQDWQESTIQGQTEMNTQAAIAGLGTPAGDQAVANVMAGIEDMGFEKNWSDEQIEVEQKKAMSGITSAKIKAVVVEDPQTAKQILEDGIASGSILPSEVPGLDAMVNKRIDDFTVMRMADVIRAQHPGDHKAMWDAANAIQDPDQRSQVMAITKTNIQMEKTFEAEQTKQDHTNQLKLWQDRGTALTMQEVIKSNPDPEMYEVGRKMAERAAEGRTEVKDNDIWYNNQMAEINAIGVDAYKKKYDRALHVEDASPAQLDRIDARLNPKKQEATGLPRNVDDLVDAAILESFGQKPKKDNPSQSMFRSSVYRAMDELVRLKGEKLNGDDQDNVIKQELYQHKLNILKHGSQSTLPFTDFKYGGDRQSLNVYLSENPIIIDGKPVPEHVATRLAKQFESENTTGREITDAVLRQYIIDKVSSYRK